MLKAASYFGCLLVPTILAACSVTEPVAVISPGIPGGIMRGTTTAALSGGSFSVSNGQLSCGGTYNALDQSPTILIPVLCNDGRKGIITATRDYSGTSGGGRFTLTDGTTGDFMRICLEILGISSYSGVGPRARLGSAGPDVPSQISICLLERILLAEP